VIHDIPTAPPGLAFQHVPSWHCIVVQHPAASIASSLPNPLKLWKVGTAPSRPRRFAARWTHSSWTSARTRLPLRSPTPPILPWPPWPQAHPWHRPAADCSPTSPAWTPPRSPALRAVPTRPVQAPLPAALLQLLGEQGARLVDPTTCGPLSLPRGLSSLSPTRLHRTLLERRLPLLLGPLSKGMLFYKLLPPAYQEGCSVSNPGYTPPRCSNVSMSSGSRAATSTISPFTGCRNLSRCA
jgi:hypothetical protein